MNMRMKRAMMTRAELLKEIEQLPADAFVSSRHAAALMGTTVSVLANWRSQRRGPNYSGHHDFVRYRICTLHDWMRQRETEVSCLEVAYDG